MKYNILMNKIKNGIEYHIEEAIHSNDKSELRFFINSKKVTGDEFTKSFNS